MKKQAKIYTILIIILLTNLLPYQIEGRTEQSNNTTRDISHIAKNVNGFLVVENHFWILGSDEFSDFPDTVNVLYKINFNFELVDSFLLSEGSVWNERQINSPIVHLSYAAIAFDGTDFLLYSGVPLLDGSGRSMIFKYNTYGLYLEEFIISITDQGRDRNIAFGDNFLWVQTADQIDAIDLDTGDFSFRFNHPGTAETISIKDIFFGENGLWIYYSGKDEDKSLLNYDYRNNAVVTRYLLDDGLDIEDIYYDGENFWILQKLNNLLSITIYDPVGAKTMNYNNNEFTLAIAPFFTIAILVYLLRFLWFNRSIKNKTLKNELKSDSDYLYPNS